MMALIFIEENRCQTRAGKTVRILCTDQPYNGCEVVGVVDAIPYVWSWRGEYGDEGQEHDMDLVEIPKLQIRYLNIYKDRSSIYGSRKEADRQSGNSRVACIRIEFRDGQFDE